MLWDSLGTSRSLKHVSSLDLALMWEASWTFCRSCFFFDFDIANKDMLTNRSAWVFYDNWVIQYDLGTSPETKQRKNTIFNRRYIFIHGWFSSQSFVSFQGCFIKTHTIHVWYIYLHESLIFMVHVGKYTSPMDPIGNWLKKFPVHLYGCFQK